MHVCLVQAGDHRAAAGFEDLRLRADQFARVGIAADKDDLVLTDGHRLSYGVLRVERMNFSALQHKICRLRLLGQHPPDEDYQKRKGPKAVDFHEHRQDSPEVALRMVSCRDAR